MIRFYFHPTPNPAKVALFPEQTGLPYEVIPVDTSKGEQHGAAFRAVNPNGKVPAIVDKDRPGGREARVFDSAPVQIGSTSKYVPEGPADFRRQARRSRLRARLRLGRQDAAVRTASCGCCA
jgi:glutathione S-transferase